MQRPSGDDRANRIQSGRLELLFHRNVTIGGGVAVAAVVACLLRSSYPDGALAAWFGAVALIGAIRYLFNRRCVRSGDCTITAARCFAIGALASGLAWGALCLGLAVWGTPEEFLLLSFVAGGMTAAATIAFSTYLPSYFAFTCAFVFPLAAVSVSQSTPIIVSTGIMTTLYLLVTSFIARHNGKIMSRAIELQVDNTILQRSLAQTSIERDHAQVEKWSTMTQLSHELRTPLNAILGFSETMHHEFFGPLGERYREYAGHVHESGRHLLKLTEELLDLSQGESGRMQLREANLDIGQLVLDLVRLMATEAKKAGLKLTGEVSAALPMMRGDETKVRQMLLNLVDNAIKFTPVGGQIAVTAGTTSGNQIYLSVRDSGIGMEPEDIPVALRPLGRLASSLHRSTDGVGLGLPICKRLAELHGAILLVDSKPQVGTTCTIQFPVERSIGPGAAIAAA